MLVYQALRSLAGGDVYMVSALHHDDNWDYWSDEEEYSKSDKMGTSKAWVRNIPAETIMNRNFDYEYGMTPKDMKRHYRHREVTWLNHEPSRATPKDLDMAYITVCPNLPILSFSNIPCGFLTVH